MSYDVPVLIVGGGPTGLATSIMLSRLGVRSLLVEKHTDTAIHPKAVGISTRTMELFRQWGIEPRVRAAALDVEFASSVRTVLAGPEAVRGTLGYPDAELAHTLSPTAPAACAQDLLEPILLSQARNYEGAELCFNTELVSIEQDASSVEATIVDRATNRGRLVRARYVVAADGAWSPLRRKLGIEMTGNGQIGDHLSILFRAKLDEVARAPLCALYVINNEIASGIMCPTSRDDRWIFATPWKPGAPVPDPCGLADLVRVATGVRDLEVDLIDANIVSLGAQVAAQFSKGRVFLVGDSAHRMTPSGGMGMNTAIHAAHNLAWKLAAVLNGWATPSLLETYEAERRPVGERNVARSIGKLPELTGIAADMGAVYRSSAVIASDDAEEQGWVKPGLPARVGQRVPHLWIDREGVQVSTLDLAERGMVLLTSTDGARWCEPAAVAARLLGIPLETCVVQTRAAFTGADHLWHAYFGLDSRSAVLLRPDGHIAWFGPATSTEPTMDVARALASVLGLSTKGAATTTSVQTQARKRRSRGSRPITMTTGEWRSRRTSSRT
jgi:2-polyprenyl-6-methoxyphenol hydroxylase-like FAD-dependent oxidoreductase